MPRIRYRGLNRPLSEISNEYIVGNTVYLHSVTSTTTDDKNTLARFGAPDKLTDQSAGTYIKLYVKSAKNVVALSRYPEEQEHMLNFNSKFMVSSSPLNFLLSIVRSLLYPYQVEHAQNYIATESLHGLSTLPPGKIFNDIVVLREII
jgi:hypothetical protein